MNHFKSRAKIKTDNRMGSPVLVAKENNKEAQLFLLIHEKLFNEIQIVSTKVYMEYV